RTQAQDKPTGASPAGSRIAEALGLLQAMQGRIDSALHVPRMPNVSHPLRRVRVVSSFRIVTSTCSAAGASGE
ncbi:hypothetical protein, partial [Mycetohabitans sp. B6]|uniref:hypothetical protein n=1 Tax=Mycetohabitans sp. B6 TaxID=2841843 RepID=UPI001F3921C8